MTISPFNLIDRLAAEPFTMVIMFKYFELAENHTATIIPEKIKREIIFRT